ncbi:MAG: hypothetical protein AABW88_04640 [Nanoarchaeota archaeon]
MFIKNDMTGGATLSDVSLDTILALDIESPARIQEPVEVLTAEHLKKSGLELSELIFNNYGADLGKLAEHILKGTHGQIDIKTLAEYELAINAIEALKKAGINKISNDYSPETSVYYHPEK